MGKSAGFLKRLKKLKDFVGKGAGWVNENLLKPMRPVIDTALDMTGYGAPLKKVVDFGSELVDKYSGYTPNARDRQIKNAVSWGTDVVLDTQRSSTDKKYANPFLNRLN